MIFPSSIFTESSIGNLSGKRKGKATPRKMESTKFSKFYNTLSSKGWSGDEELATLSESAEKLLKLPGVVERKFGVEVEGRDVPTVMYNLYISLLECPTPEGSHFNHSSRIGELIELLESGERGKRARELLSRALTAFLYVHNERREFLGSHIAVYDGDGDFSHYSPN
jgi:hypothetical protein